MSGNVPGEINGDNTMSFFSNFIVKCFVQIENYHFIKRKYFYGGFLFFDQGYPKVKHHT